MKIRVRFKKQGASVFLGHLDIMRYFQKLMRRAEVDMKYSTGYSPHQIMSFANPLGLGQTSVGEYMDIEVISNVFPSSEAMVEALNAQGPKDDSIQVLSCKIIPEDAQNAMASVMAARYKITDRINISDELREATESVISKPELISQILEKDSLITVRKSKKGEKTMDIRPLIYDWSFTDDGGCEFFVCAGSATNLKPDLIMQTFHEQANMPYQPIQYQIERIDLYTSFDEGKTYLSLDEIGESWSNL